MKAMRRGQKSPSKRATRPKAPPEAPFSSELGRRVDELAELLQRHQLSELEVEEGGSRIRLRRGLEGAQAALPAPAMAPPPPTPTAEVSDGNVSYITSPFVGTFYRAPDAQSAPFVDVGTRLRKGQVLCIVEAMKLMNEIEAETDGVIVQILVENGSAVEYGEPLFKIKQE
jgi:acetyl-CoA carboxylase biotin carboxyl carrier protein